MIDDFELPEPGDRAPDEVEEGEFKRLLSERFWAAKPSSEFASEAESRMRMHLEAYERTGLARTINRACDMYYSRDPDGIGSSGGNHEPQFLGEEGEFTYTEINHFRNHILHQKALVLPEKFAFEPQAKTTDPTALKQVPVATALLDHAVDSRGIGDRLHDGAERALVESAAWIRLDWDHDEGDLVSEQLGVFDVAYQKTSDVKDAEWVIAKSKAPKWKLAAKAFERGDEALAVAIANSDGDAADLLDELDEVIAHETADDTEDMVYVLHVYHRPTPQLPEGRYAVIIPGGPVVEDGPFPFREIPCYPIIPSMILGTTTPYSSSWDLMPIQTLENACISAITSRMDAFAIPNVWYTEGTDIGVHSNGLGTFAVPMGSSPPGVLDFMPSNSSLHQIVGMFEEMGEKLSGVNSVARGRPSENINSGSYAALVEAQAVKFNGPVDLAITRASAAVATGALRLYQQFATRELLLPVSGESPYAMQSFTRDRVSDILQVRVERTSPLTRTHAWKQDAAVNLLQAKLIKDPKEFLATVRTGTYSSIYDDSVDLAAHVEHENSRLLAGEVVQASDWDKHDYHIRKHAALLDSITRDTNPAAAQALATHCMDHMKRLTESMVSNPGILKLLGVEPVPLPAKMQALLGKAGMNVGGGAGGDPGRPTKPEMPPKPDASRHGPSQRNNPLDRMPQPPKPGKPKE